MGCRSSLLERGLEILHLLVEDILARFFIGAGEGLEESPSTGGSLPLFFG